MTHERTPQPADLASLGSHFQTISGLLAGPDGSVDAQRVVDLVGAALPHANYAGITLLRPNGSPESVAVSDPLPSRVDALQYTMQQGPCLDASRGDDVVLSPDLTTDRRWPEFAPRCVAITGVRSMMSVRVGLVGGERAALNFYALAPDAFDDLDLGVASIFAPFASMAVNRLVRDREVAGLTAALASSRQIGTAIGILMARHQVTSEQAFTLLSRASQHLNRKLRDVASDVELTGELPNALRGGRRPEQRRLDPQPD